MRHYKKKGRWYLEEKRGNRHRNPSLLHLGKRKSGGTALDWVERTSKEVERERERQNTTFVFKR